jgi:hypothetical protein
VIDELVHLLCWFGVMSSLIFPKTWYLTGLGKNCFHLGASNYFCTSNLSMSKKLCKFGEPMVSTKKGVFWKAVLVFSSLTVIRVLFP